MTLDHGHRQIEPSGRERRFRLAWEACATFALAVVISGLGLAQTRPTPAIVSVNGRNAVAGEVIVKFRRQLAQSERLQMEQELDANENETVGRDFRRVRSRRLNAQALLASLRTRAAVEYAEPNYLWYASVGPNDPRFPSLWGLLNTAQTIGGQTGTAGADIHAAAAWAVANGSRANVIAVLDTGLDYTHDDLADNTWKAPASFAITIGGASIVCAAGTHGFNAITKTCDPRDDNNHGTHVSGTIGATGNNGLGVVGVNWNASIMGLKFLDNTGSGSTSDAINAIEFAIQAKNFFGAGANVRVLSASWGGGFSQALLDEVNRANASSMLFVAAAGNGGTSNDVSPSYPASYNAPNIVSVAATDNTDHLASFSNFGSSSVHLGAPGVGILSTTIGNTYQSFSGTSMATPHVSGAAALILAQCAIDTATLKATILHNVDAIPALTDRVSTGGRLNVDRALRACALSTAPTAPSAPSGLIIK